LAVQALPTWTAGKYQPEEGSNAGAGLEKPLLTPARPVAQWQMGRLRAGEARHSEYETQSELRVLVDDKLALAKLDTVPERKEKQSVQAYGLLRLVVGVGLDPGMVRRDAPNEDHLFAVQGSRSKDEREASVGLFVVADGMGGHANGREASHLAIQRMSDVIVPVLMGNSDEDEIFPALLKEGVHRANLAIYQRNQQREVMMGTTLTAALVVDTTAYVVNVGDSRTYLYREATGLQPITRDHSHVALMVEHGVITREEMYSHPKRNQIYRCLGDKASVEVDDFVVPLRINDILLLCSDGLWEMVRDVDIEQIIASSGPHPAQISAMLVQAALNRGGADNVSVVVVHVAEADE
jgi:serine/threonine protein phosphatase PrpC